MYNRKRKMEITPNRPDLVFSHWIFLWFFLYISGIVPYNPLYLFFMGISIAVVQLSIMIFYSKSFAYILSFVFATLVTKGIPIYFLLYYTIDIKQDDIYVMVFSVIAYFVWLKINGKQINRIIDEYFTASENGKKMFPISVFFYKLLK